MKRQIVRIEDIASFYSLYNAWIKISRGDGKDKREDVIEYEKNLNANLNRLSRKLLDGSWRPDKGRTFMLYTEGKWRQIHVVDVETRIVYQDLVDHFDLKRLFVNRTFGSIKKRGTLRANKQVRRDLHRHPEYDYVIKTDFHHYYQSIVKDILMALVRRKFKGSAAIALLELCIRRYLPDSVVGISIGAVTSQNLGNYYLTPMDRFILEDLKMPCMSRNVDDTVILCRKEDGVRVIPRLIEKANEYGLTYGKIAFFPVDRRRIDFCGWAVNRTNVLVRKSTVRRYWRKLHRLSEHPRRVNKMMSIIGSYDGILKFADAYKLNVLIHKENDEVFRRIHRYTARKRRNERKAAVAAAGNGRVPPLLQRA